MPELDVTTIARVLAFTQIAILLFSLPISTRIAAMSWLNRAFVVSAVFAAGSALMFTLSMAGVSNFAGETENLAVWLLVSVGVAVLQAVVRGLPTLRAKLRDEKLETPEVRSRAAQELRDILAKEGLDLDDRLEAAQDEREQFLYALEERHAKQIAGLAEEYQAESHHILSNILDQLSAEQLKPMVEERLAEQQEAIEKKLGLIDRDAVSETLDEVQSQLDALNGNIDSAKQRIETLNKENPDADIEDRVADRLTDIEKMIESREAEITKNLDTILEAKTGEITKRIEERERGIDEKLADIGALVDKRVNAAADPLVARMEESRTQVEAQLSSFNDSLSRRFVEIDERVSQRIAEQEARLKERVEEAGGRLESRLGDHLTQVSGLLETNHAELERSANEQVDAMDSHFNRERDRLVSELAEQTVVLSEQVRTELASSQEEFSKQVGATQDAWETFAKELETRFSETREQTHREVDEITSREREQLETNMNRIIEDTRRQTKAQMEELGKEAAWQKQQVERVADQVTTEIRDKAQTALDNADSIYADLDRIGDQRVAEIKDRAEASLATSQEYVDQLEKSLAAHLEAMRNDSQTVARDLESRMSDIQSAARQAGDQLETYATDLVDSVVKETNRMIEEQKAGLSASIRDGVEGQTKEAMEKQRAAYEQHLQEVANKIVQQVNGDMAGLVEHARSELNGQVTTMVAESKDHARQQYMQAHQQAMAELARQQQELAGQAESAINETRSNLDNELKGHRRHIEEATASMGAQLREELVSFQAEAQKRVKDNIDQIRNAEQQQLREEDRRMTAARDELVKQHQSEIQNQLASMATNLNSAMNGGQGESGGFSQGLSRPQTPMSGNTESRS